MDLALDVMLLLAVFSFFNRVYMLRLLLAEYGILSCIRLFFAFSGARSDMSHVLLTTAGSLVMVGLFCFSCKKTIEERRASRLTAEEKDARIEAVDADMEDFLSNISHELRTPVNVVNGMSEMLIKNYASDEATLSCKAAPPSFSCFCRN